MDPEWVVYKDNGITGLKSVDDREPGSISINEPAILRQEGVVVCPKLVVRNANPVRLPLDSIDSKIRERMRSA